MNVEEATKIVQMPYNTEKTFAMVESEGKVCFLVERSATKPSIIDAVEILYGTRPVTDAVENSALYNYKQLSDMQCNFGTSRHL